MMRSPGCVWFRCRVGRNIFRSEQVSREHVWKVCFVFDVDDEVGVICEEEDYADIMLDMLHKHPSITKYNAAEHNYSTKLSKSEEH